MINLYRVILISGLCAVENMQLDLVLQQLFENEIDPNDVGVVDETEVPPAQLLQRRRLTLSAL